MCCVWMTALLYLSAMPEYWVWKVTSSCILKKEIEDDTFKINICSYVLINCSWLTYESKLLCFWEVKWLSKYFTVNNLYDEFLLFSSNKSSMKAQCNFWDVLNILFIFFIHSGVGFQAMSCLEIVSVWNALMHLNWALTLFYGRIIFWCPGGNEISFWRDPVIYKISFSGFCSQCGSSGNLYKTFGTTVIHGRNIKYAAPFCFTYLFLIVSNSSLKISV